MVSYLRVMMYGVGGIVVVGISLLVAFQEKLVYVPVLPGLTKAYPFTPVGLHLTYEDVWLTSSDGVCLHAWFIKLFPDGGSDHRIFEVTDYSCMGAFASASVTVKGVEIRFHKVTIAERVISKL